MGVAAHFGLSRDPFAPTVDPAEAYESQAFIAARETVQRELADGARLVALIGAAGTGKTLLLHSIERALAEAGRRVVHLARGDLLDLAALPDVDTMLIDEADRLGGAGLVYLSRLVADPKRPAVVLAFARRQFDHLDLAIAPHVVTLDELGSSDARNFIVDRIKRAGGRASLFSAGALGALTYAAGGSPRLLRLLASGAMFQAAHDGATQVGMSHARRAIAMQRGAVDLPPDEPSHEPDEMPLGPTAALGSEPAPVAAPVSPRAERLTAEPREAPPPAVPPPVLPAATPVVRRVPPDQPVPPASPAPASAGRTPTNWRPVAAAGALLLLIGGAALVWRPFDQPAKQATVAVDEEGVEPVEAVPEARVPTPAAPEPTPATKAAPVPTPAPAQTVAEPATGTVSEPVPAEPAPAPEARAEAPPPGVPAPEPAPPRIVVRYAGGQPGAADAADRIADLLEARGYEIVGVRAAPGRIREAATRYAGGERKAGEAVNIAFETVLRAYQPGAVSRAAPNAEGDAARGIIEIWVPDSAAGASRPLRTDRPPS